MSAAADRDVSESRSAHYGVEWACRYCALAWKTEEALRDHLAHVHPDRLLTDDLAQADADLAAGRARPLTEILDDLP